MQCNAVCTTLSQAIKTFPPWILVKQPNINPIIYLKMWCGIVLHENRVCFKGPSHNIYGRKWYRKYKRIFQVIWSLLE